ncbi:hypothetical protein AS181_00070 [Gordonia sp. SGD-V-85]|nr:hypothetical protein AS181_00070 [Gordonia sp. SGD-V-85]
MINMLGKNAHQLPLKKFIEFEPTPVAGASSCSAFTFDFDAIVYDEIGCFCTRLGYEYDAATGHHVSARGADLVDCALYSLLIVKAKIVHSGHQVLGARVA